MDKFAVNDGAWGPYAECSHAESRYTEVSRHLKYIVEAYVCVNGL